MPIYRVQQDTQGDLATLGGDFQAGLVDGETIMQSLLTQGEGFLDNAINTAETATGLGDADVGAAARIQQTADDVTNDVNTVIEDATGAFDAAIEGLDAQLDSAISSFSSGGAAPAAAAPAAAARRLQRNR
jgi:hypothetical protein